MSNSLSKLIALFENATNNKEKITPQKAKELVLQANVQVEDMMEYADFEHPKADCYGRKLVHHGGHFEVMIMSWNPGHYSSIHNHGYTQWGVVQVFGHTHHLLYQTKDETLAFARKEILPAGTAIKVNNALIHQMGNLSSQPYLTLHVYGSNELAGDITADAKNYDLEFDRIAHTCGGAFFNLQPEAIHSEEPGIKPTQEVFMHYAHLLMNYYNRQVQTPEMMQLKKHLLAKVEGRVLPMYEASLSS